MEKRHEVDSRSVEQTWVHGFQRERVVGTKMVVLDLDHRVARAVNELRVSRLLIPLSYCTHLTLDFGDIATGPSLVRSHRHNSCSVHTTLQQSLRIGKDRTKVVRWWFA